MVNYLYFIYKRYVFYVEFFPRQEIEVERRFKFEEVQNF